VSLRWGLVPSWAKDIKAGASMINARAETVQQKFRAAFEQRPCLVVADGFYEWKKDGKDRQPFFVTLKNNAPFAFGGLWERWRQPDGTPLETFTIVTVPANELTAAVHDRMPLMLSPDMWKDWLGTPEQRTALLKPFPAGGMETWAVSKRVGNVANDDESLVEPVTETPPDQGKLF
jgi:putative SOS response-associated peptidase YedK